MITYTIKLLGTKKKNYWNDMDKRWAETVKDATLFTDSSDAHAEALRMMKAANDMSMQLKIKAINEEFMEVDPYD